MARHLTLVYLCRPDVRIPTGQAKRIRLDPRCPVRLLPRQGYGPNGESRIPSISEVTQVFRPTASRGRYLADTFLGTVQDTTTSGSLHGEPARRRRLWQALIGLSILIVAFAVFAWQQGGDSGGGGPLNAIAEAAERTQNTPGGRAVMETIVSSPTRPAPLTVTGRVVFDAEGHSRAVMRVPRTEQGDPMEMEVVTDGTVMYMRSSKFGSLPGGSEWMALDLSLGEDPDTPLPASVDAKGELALLEAVTGKVQKLGKEDVRGVPTTHYRGTIGVSENAEHLREEGAEDLASRIEEKGSPLQIEAWIDANGLVRRMRFVQSRPPEKGGGPTTMDMRMDFFDFGIDPEIDVPESSEVFDATALTRKKLGLSGD